MQVDITPARVERIREAERGRPGSDLRLPDGAASRA